MLECHIFESQVRYNRKGYQQRVVTANIFYIISRLMEIQYIYMREKKNTKFHERNEPCTI